jgi:hypothetical protein
MTKRNNVWAAKVADFGLSRSPDADMMTSALGTLVIYIFYTALDGSLVIM